MVYYSKTSSKKYYKAPKIKSATIYVLLGLIPYTEPNLKLAFKPSMFFNDLERISAYKASTLRTAYYKAKSEGLVSDTSTGAISLSPKAKSLVRPYQAQHLPNGAKLIVIFDIPCGRDKARRQFRDTLRNLGFEMVQRSIWMTDRDHRETLRETVDTLRIAKYVEVHESIRLNLDK